MGKRHRAVTALTNCFAAAEEAMSMMTKSNLT
jgi:hypothetical protein